MTALGEADEGEEDVPSDALETQGFRFLAGAEDRGQRLDRFLADRIPGCSRSRLKSLIEDGHVLVSGAVSRPALMLKGGEDIQAVIPAAQPVSLAPEDLPLDILFEDAAILVINKAAGMVVHPGAGVPSGTVVNAVMAHCPDLPGIGGEVRPGIVHRLDKDTSGCLVIAKTEQALTALQAQFQEHSTDKRYLALVHGVPDESGRFETLHGRHPTDRLRFTSRVSRGRTAVTEWTRLDAFPSAALVSVHLLTGRTHQIRMHFSEAGHPLLCDALYGGTKREKKLTPSHPLARAVCAMGRQALHAASLTLTHPSTGARMRFEAPLPPDFAAALDILHSSKSG